MSFGIITTLCAVTLVIAYLVVPEAKNDLAVEESFINLDDVQSRFGPMIGRTVGTAAHMSQQDGLAAATSVANADVLQRFGREIMEKGGIDFITFRDKEGVIIGRSDSEREAKHEPPPIELDQKRTP